MTISEIVVLLMIFALVLCFVVFILVPQLIDFWKALNTPLTIERCISSEFGSYMISDCFDLGEPVYCEYLFTFKTVSQLPARCLKYLSWPTQNLLEAEI